jgi:hypothetical protein
MPKRIHADVVWGVHGVSGRLARRSQRRVRRASGVRRRSVPKPERHVLVSRGLDADVSRHVHSSDTTRRYAYAERWWRWVVFELEWSVVVDSLDHRRRCPLGHGWHRLLVHERQTKMSYSMQRGPVRPPWPESQRRPPWPESGGGRPPWPEHRRPPWPESQRRPPWPESGGKLAMRGFGQDDPDLAFCDEGEYFDIIAETCLCQPGKTPTAEVGGGCVYPIKAAGETTGDECLMKGMDFDIASKTCIPKCAPGQGRDMNGNCVSVGGAGGGGAQVLPPPAPKPASSFASMLSSPWFIGGALLLGVVAIGAAVSKKSATPNARRSKRPPKKWMRRCVRGVKKSGSAAAPGAVCGSLWYHKMTKAQKRAAKRRSYGR